LLAQISAASVQGMVGHQFVDNQSHGQQVRQGHVGGGDVDVPRMPSGVTSRSPASPTTTKAL